jgi:hypothetical protein
VTFQPAAKPWPPPPDIESIQELVATADIENFIAEGAPQDEYETEAELLFVAIENFPTADLLAPKILAILEPIWSQGFSLDETCLALRRPALEGLAQQIERFFGPAAQPQVR